MSGLTKKLQKLGFYCGIELEVYIYSRHWKLHLTSH